MWWSDGHGTRRACLGALGLLTWLSLAACGFQPVYAPGGVGTALSGRVTVEAPDSEEGYLLRRELETRLGRGIDDEYRLVVAPRTTTQGQAVTAAGEITRFSLVGEATYELISRADGRSVASGSVDNFTGYSATGSTVETLASEVDALERLMTILADQVVAQLFTLREL